RLGRGNLVGELLVFEVRLDELAGAAVLLGDAREAGAVGDNGRVGELLFQLAVAREGFFKAGPHDTGLGNAGGKGRENRLAAARRAALTRSAALRAAAKRGNAVSTSGFRRR